MNSGKRQQRNNQRRHQEFKKMHDKVRDAVKRREAEALLSAKIKRGFDEWGMI